MSNPKPAMQDLEFTVYCEATNKIIDLFARREDAQDAILRFADKYGNNLIVLPFDEAIKRKEDHFITEPEEITEAQWWEALEVLPPKHWYNTAQGESFKMAEHMCGNITSIYVQIEKRYFTFQDSAFLPHAECCKRVRGSHAFKNEQNANPES